ncbi:hypothetical protein TWF481_007470 [Arthrobotrys musiformis]|uniref:Transmembrane protein n=1 Tax=Arthrobotrys musiformis TaxID=47236 RepID=A0AAV9WHB9_9PEZI
MASLEDRISDYFIGLETVPWLLNPPTLPLYSKLAQDKTIKHTNPRVKLKLLKSNIKWISAQHNTAIRRAGSSRSRVMFLVLALGFATAVLGLFGAIMSSSLDRAPQTLSAAPVHVVQDRPDHQGPSWPCPDGPSDISEIETDKNPPADETIFNVGPHVGIHQNTAAKESLSDTLFGLGLWLAIATSFAGIWVCSTQQPSPQIGGIVLARGGKETEKKKKEEHDEIMATLLHLKEMIERIKDAQS